MMAIQMTLTTIMLYLKKEEKMLFEYKIKIKKVFYVFAYLLPVSRLFGQLSMYPDFMDTFLCVQTL